MKTNHTSHLQLRMWLEAKESSAFAHSKLVVLVLVSPTPWTSTKGKNSQGQGLKH